MEAKSRQQLTLLVSTIVSATSWHSALSLPLYRPISASFVPGEHLEDTRFRHSARPQSDGAERTNPQAYESGPLLQTIGSQQLGQYS